ncbi:hypothetical protein [Nitrobacter sp. TKz-YC02]|uniref:hypothetical protein n=1 Tax=Nitrobacter sp. TKz-YC02 TaxID=3398704 RepID=UPI003CE77DA2
MSIDQASKNLPTFAGIRTGFEGTRWGWLLIAMIAIIAADTLLAAGAWIAVGYIIGK